MPALSGVVTRRGAVVIGTTDMNRRIMKFIVFPSPDGNEIPICWTCANESGISTYTIESPVVLYCTRCGKQANTDFQVERWCRLCDKPSAVILTADQMYRFITSTGPDGKPARHMQNILPDLSPGLRETLISGSHEACFDEAFGEDDEGTD